LTYDALWAATEDMAGRLLALGLNPGDRLAVQAGKSPTLALLYLACIRSGVVFLPFNTAYRPAELDVMVGDARPHILLCDPDAVPGLEPVAADCGARLLTLDRNGGGQFTQALAATTAGTLSSSPVADAPAVMLYTSGTTGRPKGAVLTQANLATNTQALRSVWDWRADDRLLHALPLYHTHGLFPALNLSLAGGGECIMLPGFEPAAVLRHLPRATVFMGVPTYYARLLREQAFNVAACRHMRLFISGSAPLPDAVFHAFAERAGHRIVERYGMTEAVMITANPLDDRRPSCAGRPLPGVALRVVDDAGTQLPPEQEGGIEITGPNVFPEYWRAPEKTAEAFRADGYFITGDRGRLDRDGRLWISGRASDLIISGGLNVAPREVETALDRLPGVAESAVIGVPHEDWGEAVVALVCAVPDTQSPDPAGLLSGLGDIAAFKRPKRIVLVDSLPRNAMGKVEKARLRQDWRHLFTK